MTESDTGKEWVQVSIDAEPHLAEELADALGEILPGGVVLEKNYGDLFPHELKNFRGPVRLYGYFPAEMRQDIQERLSRVLEVYQDGFFLDRVMYAPLESRNWATAWQERYHPIPVGNSLVIVPTWLENPYLKRIPIWMDPGMAFGSGVHPTTQLSLTLLETSLAESIPKLMIDVGCGSGILSIGAVKLGVKKVLGVDIDLDAVRIAVENSRVNKVSGSTAFREGSVKDILLQGWTVGGASLVVANIIAPVLIDLFDEGLGDLVLPGGKIILSGILREQFSAILACLDRSEFICVGQQEQEDWVGLIAEKASP